MISCRNYPSPAAIPRQFETLRFTEGVEKIEDVKPGIKLPGIVTNITAFGVFVALAFIRTGWCISAKFPTVL